MQGLVIVRLRANKLCSRSSISATIGGRGSARPFVFSQELLPALSCRVKSFPGYAYPSQKGAQRRGRSFYKGLGPRRRSSAPPSPWNFRRTVLVYFREARVHVLPHCQILRLGGVAHSSVHLPGHLLHGGAQILKFALRVV